MRRLILALLLATVTTTPAWAGSIQLDLGGTPLTITTTARQDAVVATITAKINQQIAEQNVRNQADNDAAIAQWNATNAVRAALTPPLDPLPASALKTISPSLTPEGYVKSILVGTYQDWIKQADTTDAASACALYPALSGADKLAITSRLGGKPPCP